MTVSELIKLLEAIENKELKVLIEGDWHLDTEGIWISENPSDPYVLITRE